MNTDQESTVGDLAAGHFSSGFYCAESVLLALGTPEGQAKFHAENLIERCARITRRSAEIASTFLPARNT